MVIAVLNKYVRPANTRTESTLAASLVSRGEYMPTGQTDRRTEGRTPDRYITLSAKRGRPKNAGRG